MYSIAEDDSLGGMPRDAVADPDTADVNAHRAQTVAASSSTSVGVFNVQQHHPILRMSQCHKSVGVSCKSC